MTNRHFNHIRRCYQANVAACAHATTKCWPYYLAGSLMVIGSQISPKSDAIIGNNNSYFHDNKRLINLVAPFILQGVISMALEMSSRRQLKA